MEKKFEIEFLKGVDEFMETLDQKAKQKILYNIKAAQFSHNPELFKKLNYEIWEFRTLFNKTHYRLFAFWDNENGALVIATHGLIKKTDKTPSGDIEKEQRLRKEYFITKNSENEKA